jgi:hypothetical protein
VGPIAAGLLVARVGYAHMFQLMTLIVLAVAAVFFFSTRGHGGLTR